MATIKYQITMELEVKNIFEIAKARKRLRDQIRNFCYSRGIKLNIKKIK